MSGTPDSVVVVRYSKATSIGCTAFGGALFVVWIYYLFNDPRTSWYALVLALLFTYMGINSFSRPFCVYDVSTGSIVFPAILGTRRQVIGGANRERLERDGTRLRRVDFNGKVRPVSRWTSDKADFDRLLEAVSRPVSEDRWKQRERRKQ
ncbi:hypothetical protein [Glycomyces artemisiae]|uniref:PH (Pleckstrin Homology) domain-containing protein n=1 Tax=Glycomyces artemisiae TaxID=1076443 RepID=A0A2T0UWF1_9ACTN|nr:hypothetical protein [Glycomyces artemisiae]PRY62253.1 hypothetical protein B0I28_101581 [Glycomyces artemisiae]